MREIAEERSSKIRTLASADSDPDFDSDDDSEGVPVRTNSRGKYPEQRKHKESGTLTRAALDHIDEAMRTRLGAGLAEDTKALISTELEVQFNRLLVRLSDQRKDAKDAKDASLLPAPKSRLAWGVVAALTIVLFIGSMAVTWDRIRNVEQRQKADEEYAMIVANWLVIENSTNFDRASKLDSMLRAIASKVGADVSNIAPPVQTQPPTAIQRRNSNFVYKDE